MAGLPYPNVKSTIGPAGSRIAQRSPTASGKPSSRARNPSAPRAPRARTSVPSSPHGAGSNSRCGSSTPAGYERSCRREVASADVASPGALTTLVEGERMRPARLELATFASAGQRSIPASFPWGNPGSPTAPSLRAARNAPGKIRTCDLCLRRAALYPLSYGRGERSVAGTLCQPVASSTAAQPCRPA